MALDATGTPTSPDSIPKYNTAVDPPSGKGFNAAMDAIQVALSARTTALAGKVDIPAAMASGEAVVWNGAAWVRSSVTRIGVSSLGSGVPSSSNFLRGDGTWAATSGAMVQLYDNTASGAIASWDVSTGLSGYNHLKIVLLARGDTAATSVAVQLRLNNDSAANYASQVMRGVAAGVTAGETNSATSMQIATVSAATATASHPGTYDITIAHYGGTTFFKHVHSHGGWSQALTTSTRASETNEGVWASTSAITRITLFPASGNFIAGSRLSIYGIL